METHGPQLELGIVAIKVASNKIHAQANDRKKWKNKIQQIIATAIFWYIISSHHCWITTTK